MKKIAIEKWPKTFFTTRSCDIYGGCVADAGEFKGLLLQLRPGLEYFQVSLLRFLFFTVPNKTDPATCITY